MAKQLATLTRKQNNRLRRLVRLVMIERERRAIQKELYGHTAEELLQFVDFHMQENQRLLQRAGRRNH